MSSLSCEFCCRFGFQDQRALNIHIAKNHVAKIDENQTVSFDSLPREMKTKRKWGTGLRSDDVPGKKPASYNTYTGFESSDVNTETGFDAEDLEYNNNTNVSDNTESSLESDDTTEYDVNENEMNVENNETVADLDNIDVNFFISTMKKIKKEKLIQNSIPIEVEAGIELLSMLRQSNASMQLYNKILKWTEKYFMGNNEIKKPPSRESITKYLTNRYKLECLKPCQVVCKLPSTNLSFNVVCHHFFSCLFSLLTDESLMKPENLIFSNDKRKPASIDYSELGVYNELHSGEAFQSYMKKIIAPEQTVVLPLIIFGDGTVVDHALRKPMEPFSFTLGIFHQNVRAKPAAWRILCYMKNNPYCLMSPEEISQGEHYWQTNSVKNNNPAFVLDNKRDWHSQLFCGLKDLLEVQQFATGMKFKLPWATWHS